MTINLPDDLERSIRAEVHRGHFPSEDEAIAEAIRLLQQRGQAPSMALDYRIKGRGGPLQPPQPGSCPLSAERPGERA